MLFGPRVGWQAVCTFVVCLAHYHGNTCEPSKKTGVDLSLTFFQHVSGDKQTDTLKVCFYVLNPYYLMLHQQ